MNNFIIAFLLIVFSQTVTYFQLQSQFFWKWSKDNPIWLSLLGMPLSYLLIKFTKYCALAFNGQVWPGRLIGFAVGAIIFAILSTFIMKEPLTLKTGICLILAAGILAIQMIK